MDAELLQTLLANPAAAREQLQERIAADPQLAMFAQMMNLRAEPEPAPAPRPARSRRDDRIARVRDRVAEMRDELVRLRARTTRLAAALGACGRCWGDDSSCATCGGQGIAGWLDPEPLAFHELVAPAVSRLADRTDDTDHEEQP
ncbi:MAG: hypothetical protein KIT31_23815 [Deltaproteobacteria bacterium]|nr:hypothetical protein [Deltaproteobacteria bacterium]